jgi:hypothetical protein
LSSGVLTYGFCKIAGIQLAPELYGIFAFLGTFTIYNFQRIVKFRSSPNDSLHLKWVGENLHMLIALTILTGLATALVSIYLVHWNYTTLTLGTIVLLVSIFYALKVQTKNLRDLPFFKIHLISAVWVITIAVFPLVNEQIYTHTIWTLGLSHYFYFLAICIPFDIRDLAFDKPSQRTIPQVLGVQSSKMIGILLLIAFLFIAVYCKSDLGQNKLFIIAIIIQTLFIYFTSRTQSDFYFGGFIDGAILLLGLSYLF